MALTMARRPRQEIEKIAQETMQKYGLAVVPVDPVVLADRMGVQIYHAKFKDDKVSGMIRRRGKDVAIYLNPDRSFNRKRFTIAHEIGHHVLHFAAGSDEESVDYEMDLFRTDAGAAWSDRAMEAEANQFAAAVLMPDDKVKKYWSLWRSVGVMAEFFNVSEEAMAVRLNTLGLA